MTDLLIEIVCPIVTVFVLCCSFVIRPVIASCPEQWHSDGVRRSGEFRCTRAPIGDPEWDGTWQRSPDRSMVPPGEIGGRIYCTDGAVPIIVSARTVGCQR